MGDFSHAFSPDGPLPFLSHTGLYRARALRFSLPCFKFYLARLRRNQRGGRGRGLVIGGAFTEFSEQGCPHRGLPFSPFAGPG